MVTLSSSSEAVEIKCPQRIRGSFFWFQFAPCVKGFLRLLKDVFTLGGVRIFIQMAELPL